MARMDRQDAGSRFGGSRFGSWIDRNLQDLRLAARNLRRRPSFTAAAVATLALGLGANTAIFSVIQGVLLSDLPWSEPRRLVAAWELGRHGSEMRSAWGNFLDWREARSFAALSAYSTGSPTVLGGDAAVIARAALVSEGFFRVLGAQPAAGRLFLPEDHRAGALPAAVVSESFLHRYLGGDPEGLVHRRLDLWGMGFQVVGVLPDALAFPAGVEIWAPLELQSPGPVRTAHNYRVVGRLAAGVSLEQAGLELDTITKAIVSDEPSDYLPAGALVRPLKAEITGRARQPLWVLLGATALVMLVAGSNLASAFLARGLERRQEIAVRSWLGAGTARLLGPLVAESLLLSAAGAAAGLVLAAALREYLLALAPPGLPRLDQVAINLPVLAFAVGLAVLTALLFGVLPSLRLARRSGGLGPVSGQRATAGRQPLRVWNALIAGEVALALVLLVSAGLLVRTLGEILRIEPGFTAERVATVSVSLPSSRYAEPQAIEGYYRSVIAELTALPGVRQVGFSSALPFAGDDPSGQMLTEGGPLPNLDAGYRAVGGGYFDALGIPVLLGRALDERDRAGSEFVVVVSQAFADRAWPGKDPLGQRVNAAGMDQYWQQDVWASVVGVVGDVRHGSLTAAIQPTAYFPALQRPQSVTQATIAVATAGELPGLLGALGEACRRADAEVPARIGTLGEHLARSVAEQRFALQLLGGFAVLALLLTAIGITGVVTYAVTRRRRELSLRVALGGRRDQVLRFVVGRFLAVVGAGLVAGVALAAGLTRFLGNLLYGVRPTDPLTFAGVLVLLGLIALAASYLPARRILRIEPADVLRGE